MSDKSNTSVLDTASTFVLRMSLFLIDQFMLCMAGRSEPVRRRALERLRRMGQVFDPTVHTHKVGNVKVEAVPGFVDSFLQFIPYLPQVAEGLQEAISYAIMDVYLLATGPKVLGSLLAELALAKTDTEKDVLLSNALVSVEQYIQLLAAVPHIAYFRVEGIGLWCMEPRGNGGRPSTKLRADIEAISTLGDYLPDHQITRFAAALALARRSTNLREVSPLRLERIGRWDVAAAFTEEAIMVEAACHSALIAPVQTEDIDQQIADGFEAIERNGVVEVHTGADNETGVEPE